MKTATSSNGFQVTLYRSDETPATAIPEGFERLSLIKDARNNLHYFQSEKSTGALRILDSEGMSVSIPNWELSFVLADVHEDDSDTFFEIVEGVRAELPIPYELG